MNKGIKYRIYPNSKQKKLINQTLGSCRFVYNFGLKMHDDAFKKGEIIKCSTISNTITKMKKTKEYAFLKEVDSIALQQSLRDLDKAFIAFYKKKSKFPQLKKKHDIRQSYRTQNIDNGIRLQGNYLRLPKLGYVRAKQKVNANKINNATIIKTASGKYFAVLNIDYEPIHFPDSNNSIGIDVGIKNFYTDSNGRIISNPRYLLKSEKKLKREQRRLSRKQLGSNNRDKQRIRVAKVYETISNQRNDFLQKESTRLVRENQTICIEELNIKGMVKNHRLAKSIMDISWDKFFTMLDYKASWYGCKIVRIPMFYPSSQICNKCGALNPMVKNLKIREWECPSCHVKLNRDVNASINILCKGLQMA